MYSSPATATPTTTTSSPKPPQPCLLVSSPAQPTATPSPISTDGRCGASTPNDAICAGSGLGSCCSNNGWCGDTLGHCGPGNCYTGACIISDMPVSSDRQCGTNTPNVASCVESGFGDCCSLYGWCSDSEDHCGKGKCYSRACL